MHAIVRRYEGIDAGSMEEVIRRGTDELVPLIRETPGFVAHYVIGGEGGALVSVSVFEDRSAAEASSRKVLERIQGDLAALFPQPQVTMGEVLVHTLGATTGR
jgi:hypothetical protein